MNGHTNSNNENLEIEQFYEERADHLELEAFKNNTALTDDSDVWIEALTGKGAKLLVGPRGCGKTHLMRFAFCKCRDDSSLPFAIYTNLNRYYRLEPLLRKRPEAIPMFYTWVLANIFVGLYDALGEFKRQQNLFFSNEDLVEFDIEKVQDLIGILEQSRPLDEAQENIAASLNIDRIKALIVRVTAAVNRGRAVLFLDDAALTLTPEYLSHFFDIYRAIKAARIAPKASVYPGTTEYGPNFHAAHEAETVLVWKAVTDENYLTFMKSIGIKRFPEVQELPEEIQTLFAFAAFGMPRSFMQLVRNYLKATNSSSSTKRQSFFNGVIEGFCNDKLKEYLSLRQKKTHLATIINAGNDFFRKVVAEVATECKKLAESSGNQLDSSIVNSKSEKEHMLRQIFIGVDSSGINGKPYIGRMLRMLEEVGLLYKFPTVSHGDRDYVRYVPHLAALQEQGAFSRKGGFSAKFSVEMLGRNNDKHPVRRSISTLLSADILNNLGLDLPNCVNCGSKRGEGAKYCFFCGAKLTDESSYERLMHLQLSVVPGLTNWQREKLVQATSVPKTIGEFLTLQDQGTALRTIPSIGQKRAKDVIDAVETFLEEYLS